MNRDNRLLLIIALIIVAIIGVIIGSQKIKEAVRPELLEVRVLSATAADPVFREGSRRVGPDDEVDLAVALRLQQVGKGEYWLSPVKTLEIDGQVMEHVVADSWPDDEQLARVFWFTVECGRVGGELNPKNAADAIAYRTFLAPEMGHAMRAQAYPRAKNTEFIAPRGDEPHVMGGTLRFYARVEIAASKFKVQPLQAVSSLGPGALDNEAMPMIQRTAKVPPGIRPEVGELFNLPCFLLPDDPEQQQQVEAASGQTMVELVNLRLATSSATFAAVAITGSPEMPAGQLQELATLDITDDDPPDLRGRRLVWQEHIRPGDLLVADNHWIVLKSDDGNGELDPADSVLHCWKLPPAAEALGSSLAGIIGEARLLRHVPEPAP